MRFGYQSKTDRNEVAVSDFHPMVHDDTHQLYSAHRPPMNEYQALMEAPHGVEPEKSETELEAEWQHVENQIRKANLTEREIIVLNCMVYGGMSLSKTAIVVAQAEGLNVAPAKMTIARCRDRAINKLRKVFKEETDVVP